MILGILAMMLLLPLAMPDSAFAREKLKWRDVNSVTQTCKKLEKRIGELEDREKEGTITDKEKGELNSARELHDIAECGIIALKKKTDQEKYEDQGYKCERAGVDSIICTKKGEHDKICDNAGSCTRINPTNPNPIGGLPKSPTTVGVDPAQTHPNPIGGLPKSPTPVGVAPAQEVLGEGY
jgi:hypothetical protein